MPDYMNDIGHLCNPPSSPLTTEPAELKYLRLDACDVAFRMGLTDTSKLEQYGFPNARLGQTLYAWDCRGDIEMAYRILNAPTVTQRAVWIQRSIRPDLWIPSSTGSWAALPRLLATTGYYTCPELLDILIGNLDDDTNILLRNIEKSAGGKSGLTMRGLYTQYEQWLSRHCDRSGHPLWDPILQYTSYVVLTVGFYEIIRVKFPDSVYLDRFRSLVLTLCKLRAN